QHHQQHLCSSGSEKFKIDFPNSGTAHSIMVYVLGRLFLFLSTRVLTILIPISIANSLFLRNNK
ncbi:MAG: hypothetical protein ACKO7D_00890, partial [Bacteroidota bacterium]